MIDKLELRYGSGARSKQQRRHIPSDFCKKPLPKTDIKPRFVEFQLSTSSTEPFCKPVQTPPKHSNKAMEYK